MDSTNETMNREGSSMVLTQKIMVQGFVCLEGNRPITIEIRRGMPILSEESLEVGKVAAVLLDNETRKTTHILLSRLPEMKGYWLVPVDLILGVCEGNVQLRIPVDAIGDLPLWQSFDQ
jgi:hypothetical protein